jgi:hypothetical protein
MSEGYHHIRELIRHHHMRTRMLERRGPELEESSYEVKLLALLAGVEGYPAEGYP